MRRLLFLAVLAALLVSATSAFAQAPGTTSLLDPSRLSVGLRAYRSFDEVPGVAGSYASGWWAGVPLAWEITSPKDPAVKLPVSVIAAIDFRIPTGGQEKLLRGYLGVGFLLKRSGS